MPRDVDELEEKLETMKMETQLLSQKQEQAEKKALIRQIKRKYGRSWREVIGGVRDNHTLRQLAESRFRLV